MLFDNLIMPAVINSGEKVKVPYLIGKKLDKAKFDLEKLGLSWKITKETYSEKFPSGTIISQMPSPNLFVKSSRPILLTVSKGQEKVAVPYLIGSSLRSAKLSLVQRGLELGNVVYDYSDLYPKDTIFSQSISAGTMVPFGSKINIIISKGPINQTLIPSLIGYSFDEVKLIIEGAGFVLGSVQYKISETYLPNTVIDQFPKPNELASPGTVIDVIIAK